MVIDTSVLIAIAWDEPERRPFQEAIGQDPTRLMSAGSKLEAAIVMMRRAGREAAAEAARSLGDLIDQLGIEIEPVTSNQARLAELAYQTFGRSSTVAFAK